MDIERGADVRQRNGRRLRPLQIALTLATIRATSLDNRALQRSVREAGLDADTGSVLRHDPIVTRLQFGSEFCDRLQPSPRQLERALALARGCGLDFTLTTSILSDSTLTDLRTLLSLLDPGTEVVANDWGTLRLLGARFPSLVPIAGRLLCKMVKDPRLPSRQWSMLYPPGVHSRSFCTVLERFNVKRIEMDVAPFAAAYDLESPAMAVSVHVPYGFAAKGRMCWYGSLHEPDAEKFTVVPACRRECVRYRARRMRPMGAAADLETVQRGNTLLYRHSPEMAQAVTSAASAGAVDRIIVSGDWH